MGDVGGIRFCIIVLFFITKDILVKGDFDCASNWVSLGGRCFKLSSEKVQFDDAVTKCKELESQLWIIESQAENDLFIDQSGTSMEVWINRKYDGYGNRVLKGSPLTNLAEDIYIKGGNYPTWNNYHQCLAYMTRSGVWGPSYCYENNYFVCVKNSIECAEGFFGPSCDEKCHCARGSCDTDTGYCSSGCVSGWTGHSCDREKRKVEGAFYCINSEEKGRTMIFKADQHGVPYREVTALDKTLATVSTCNKSVFSLTPGGLVSLTLHENNKQFMPDCGAERLSFDVVKWRFRFREFPHTRSKYDVVFQVTCDFTKADNLQRTSDINTGKLPSISQTLTASHVSVGFQVMDAQSDVELLSVKVGQSLIIKLNFKQNQVIGEFGVRRIAPYSCSTSTSDGKISIPFLDEDGCIPEDPLLRLLPSNGSNFESLPFDAFAFPGQEHVVFNCHIEICFSDDDPLCLDRCKNAKQASLPVNGPSTEMPTVSNATEPVRRKRRVGLRLAVVKS